MGVVSMENCPLVNGSDEYGKLPTSKWVRWVWKITHLTSPHLIFFIGMGMEIDLINRERIGIGVTYPKFTLLPSLILMPTS